MAAHGINFGRPVIALSKLREWKDKEVVNKLTGGLVQLAKQRNIQVVHGVGKFTASNQLQVVDAEGKSTTIGFDKRHHRSRIASQQDTQCAGRPQNHGFHRSAVT